MNGCSGFGPVDYPHSPNREGRWVTFIIAAPPYFLKEVIFVLGKLVTVAGLGLIICGTRLAATPVPAPPQVETRQDPAQKEMQERMGREANKKRQQDIREETDKLFQLATELKAAVDKTNENLLSIDVVRKAEEVEKLAKKVKEKMKESVGPPAKSEPPIPRPHYLQ
jgi:gas vesicle protein